MPDQVRHDEIGVRHVADTLRPSIPAAQLIERINRTTLASSSHRFWTTAENVGHDFIEANRDDIGKNVVPFRSLAPWSQPAQG
jgi:hypothetical protein